MAIHHPYLGRYYEDFTVGDVYKHWPGRTISETDNAWFTMLTLNSHPVHFDHNYAGNTYFGRPLVNSTLTLSIVVGMSVRDTSQNAVANLGWDRIKLPNPVFHGDTLYAESKVLAKRQSRSKPNMGIVDIQTTGYNQRNETVIVFDRTMLIKCKKYDEGKLPSFGSPKEEAAP